MEHKTLFLNNVYESWEDTFNTYGGIVVQEMVMIHLRHKPCHLVALSYLPIEEQNFVKIFTEHLSS